MSVYKRYLIPFFIALVIAPLSVNAGEGEDKKAAEKKSLFTLDYRC